MANLGIKTPQPKLSRRINTPFFSTSSTAHLDSIAPSVDIQIKILGRCKEEDIVDLFNTGVDVNSTDSDGFTFLHIAALQGNVRFVEIALNYGANINALTELGHSALMLSLFEFHEDVTRLLLDRGAVDYPDAYGQFAVHIAAAQGSEHALAQLLILGQQVNVRDHKGHTPLHMASASGREDVIELLLAHGADVNATNNAGETPMHIAAQRDRQEVCDTESLHG